MLKRTVTILMAVAILHVSLSSLHSSEINLPRSGQAASYGTGDDGAVKAGLSSPSPRFTASNGKVIDNLTGLVWLQNANCTETVGGVTKGFGYLPWASALTWSNSLFSGKCGLTDGSTAGYWRLPTRKELQTLLDAAKNNPALPTGHPFINLKAAYYWSSSTYAASSSDAWFVSMLDGIVDYGSKTGNSYVWPVSGGQ